MKTEWKVGEIFEYNGEWYQCIPDTTDDNCNNCFFQKSCGNITGNCSSTARSDGKTIAFKKLEKVGEPMEFTRGLYFQRYCLAYSTAFYEGDTRLFFNAPTKTFVYIEIKQTKEDMEENKLNLKPFDLQKAKEGKPVCTRDGRKARIICFDIKGSTHPIVALIEKDEKEVPSLYMLNGKKYEDEEEWKGDLMMLPEKKEGWVNIVRGSDGGRPHMGRGIFQSKEEAENAIKAFSDNLIDIVKISWEEQP